VYAPSRACTRTRAREAQSPSARLSGRTHGLAALADGGVSSRARRQRAARSGRRGIRANVEGRQREHDRQHQTPGAEQEQPRVVGESRRNRELHGLRVPLGTWEA
jgi:IS5 family transposase